MAKEQSLPALVIDNYPVFNPQMAGVIQEIIKTNLGDDFTLRDLERIKVPAGGGTVWEVPTPEGLENREVLSGIIVGSFSRRAFWREAKAAGSGDTPPDCSSYGNVRGIGVPGGECASCPNNVFGSANEGKGRAKACREGKDVLLLLEGSMLPVVLQVPSTSLKSHKNYLLKLASGGKGIAPAPYYGVVTHFKLAKAKNKDGTVYSEIAPTRGDIIPADKMTMAKAYADDLGKALEHAITNTEAPDFSD